MFGWSPARLQPDSSMKRRVDRFLPSSGWRFTVFFAVVVALLNVGVVLPRRLDLLSIAVASLAAGGWCALNFWRSRHAHCLLTGSGWLALGLFSLVEVGIGRSLIHGDEGLIFVGVLIMGLLFELAWFVTHGSNAVPVRSIKPGDQ